MLCEALAGAQAAALQSLRLPGCRLGDRGACCVARLLQHNRSITQLDLSHNGIEDAGAAALAEVCGVFGVLGSVWDGVRHGSWIGSCVNIQRGAGGIGPFIAAALVQSNDLGLTCMGCSGGQHARPRVGAGRRGHQQRRCSILRPACLAEVLAGRGAPTARACLPPW